MSQQDPQPEQQAAVPAPITGEQGAISMAANPVAGNKMAFDVTCNSFDPPSVQKDETGAQTPMTQTAAPSGNTPGTYLNRVTFTAEGDHDIICFNSNTRVRQKVFAGDIPVWDPDKVENNTFAGRQADIRRQGAAILGTTGKVG